MDLRKAVIEPFSAKHAAIGQASSAPPPPHLRPAVDTAGGSRDNGGSPYDAVNRPPTYDTMEVAVFV